MSRTGAVPPLAVLAILAGLLSGCRETGSPMDAAGLVDAMHARYSGVRPASLTIVQTTVTHREAGAVPDTTTWYEAALPGLLRIDFAPFGKGNGALYRNGELLILRAGNVVERRQEVNPLQVLLMDVFQFAPERTVHVLDTLGFDLSRIRRTQWEGMDVWVVGADEGDESAPQFWVDADRLVAVRIMQPVGGGTVSWDVRVTEHREMDGYPQEIGLVMYLDGRLYQEEVYEDVRAGVDLDPALFDTTGWLSAGRYWE